MRHRRRNPNESETPAEVERILGALADQDADDGLPAPADERLHAYREGRLTADETRELEGLLARSAAGRRRLLALDGLDHTLPLRRVRRAVLAAADRRRPRTHWLAAAAAIAASILLVVLILVPRQSGLPAGLTYDVAARGLAEVRSADEVPGEARAYPGTTVRVLVRPRGSSPAGASFALYRREDGGLRRVRQPEEVRLASDRGSATFAGRAAKVLGTGAPGAYPLFVVVYAREDLPAFVKLEPGQDPAGALRARGRLVYPLTVTLLRGEPPAEEEGR